MGFQAAKVGFLQVLWVWDKGTEICPGLVACSAIGLSCAADVPPPEKVWVWGILKIDPTPKDGDGGQRPGFGGSGPFSDPAPALVAPPEPPLVTWYAEVCLAVDSARWV